jgi:hypothetical protein
MLIRISLPLIQRTSVMARLASDFTELTVVPELLLIGIVSCLICSR